MMTYVMIDPTLATSSRNIIAMITTTSLPMTAPEIDATDPPLNEGSTGLLVVTLNPFSFQGRTI
jgi:hypothetical protein